MKENIVVKEVIKATIKQKKDSGILLSKITENISRGTIQFKTIIPKEFAEKMGLNGKDFYVEFKLESIENPSDNKLKLTAEVKKYEN